MKDLGDLNLNVSIKYMEKYQQLHHNYISVIVSFCSSSNLSNEFTILHTILSLNTKLNYDFYYIKIAYHILAKVFRLGPFIEP